MKLIVSIINGEDAQALLDALFHKGFQAAAFNAAGYWLHGRNTVILTGAEADRVAEVVAVIQETCPARVQYSNPLPPVMEPGEIFAPTPTEMEIGGATVFVLDAEQFFQF